MSLSECFGVSFTQTQRDASERRRRFRLSIEKTAAELAAKKAAELAAKEAAPVVVKLNPAPLVPAPDAEPAPAPVEVPPRERHWFRILGLAENSLNCKIIVDSVARELGVSPAELMGERRNQPVVFYRQIAMMLCKELIPGKSLPAIGRVFGGRDHTTVLHACRMAPKRIAENKKLAAAVVRIRAELQTILDLPRGVE